MTLIEASIMLATVSLLTATMAPTIAIYMEQARQARAAEDVKTIGDAINEFISDNGEHQFLRVGHGAGADDPPTHADSNRVDLLVSDGDIPLVSNVVLNLGDVLWIQAVNGTDIASLSDHLIENGPNDDSSTNRYRNPSDITIASNGGNIDFARVDSSGQNAPYSWRGAYLRGPVNSDPWGNRYAVNTAFLDPIHLSSISGISVGDPLEYPRMDVFVLSAGPDEEIDTPFCQDGAVPGDDDIIFLVSANAK
jgi:type II secretory pathway pseudopilin PulG